MANQNNAWGIQDESAIDILQGIWDYIFGATVPAKTLLMGPIFAMVSPLLLSNMNFLQALHL
jgi:hypothetical protein